MSATSPPEAQHRILVRLLVIAASVLAFLSIFTTWIDRQALDTDEWVDTSGRLLEDKTISDEVANYAVDELYASVDVQQLIQARLPTDLKPLSGAAAGGLREFGVNAGEHALQTPRVQAIWRQANRTAHTQLIAILEDKSTSVSSANGTVTLDLRPIVKQLADRIGIGGQISERLPADVAQLEIVRSDQLETAQKIDKAIKGLAIVFSLGTLLLFGLAAYLAKGRRWLVVFGYGIGLIVSGVAALALRKVGQGIVVDSLAKTENVRPAANHAYSIGTDLLSGIATTAIAYGVLFVIASWLASPASSAVAIRRTLAPSFRARPALSWGIFAGLALLFLIIRPPQSNRELLFTLALIAVAGIGIEALERKSRHEFPDAEPGEWRVRMAARMREFGQSGATRMRSAIDDFGAKDDDDARLERLAKLGELKQAGVLTPAEFKAEKQRLLGTPTTTAPRKRAPKKSPAKRPAAKKKTPAK
ncbi:MAG: SHOCT domain-containing protein [Solirubrobacterales bacterium]